MIKFLKWFFNHHHEQRWMNVVSGLIQLMCAGVAAVGLSLLIVVAMLVVGVYPLHALALIVIGVVAVLIKAAHKYKKGE